VHGANPPTEYRKEMIMSYIKLKGKIQVGKYGIEVFEYPNNHKEIWIQSESGEAGGFDYTKFEDTIDMFFRENF
jgi:hypothetical protein